MGKSVNISKTYFFWLCELIDIYPRKSQHNLLIADLGSKEFKWHVPNDDNRAEEGRNLREKFCTEEGIEYDFNDFEEKISMLELIIALAYRCDSFMADTINNVSISEWFWRLLENVGLDKFTDDNYDPEEVDKILDKIVRRTYHRSGKGGLFPLKHATVDQRKTELWYQMCQYLVENYYVEELIV